MSERLLLKMARRLIAVLSPMFVTFVVFACVLIGGFWRLLRVGLIPSVVGYVVLLLLVLFLTTIVPSGGIYLFRRLARLKPWEAYKRRNLNIPYVLSVLSYTACTVMLYLLRTPIHLQSVMIAAMVSLMVCAIINIWWKVSVHMFAMGGASMVVAVCGLVMNFNPLVHLSLLFLLSGLLGSSLMMLRRHTFAQVMSGFVIGALCTAMFVLRGFTYFITV